MRSLLAFVMLFQVSCVDLGVAVDYLQNKQSKIAEVLTNYNPSPYDLTVKEISERREGESEEDYQRRIKKEQDDMPKAVPKSRSLACDLDAYRDGPKVTLDALDHLNSKNISRYELKGRCSENDRPVKIQVNGHPVSSNPFCDRGKWEVFLNLSSVFKEGDVTLTFRVSHGEDSNVICKDVKSAFSCPENYVPVPGNEDFYTRSFCVMKYEAKLDKSSSQTKIISQPEDRPVAFISYSQAVTLCKSQGSHYDLINNDQWQNIVRLIEEEDSNWSLGKSRIVDGNSLNCGVSLGTPKPASSNDDDDCAGSTCGSGWDYHRRTHALPSGDIIWDMCGNVGEIMKNKNHDKFSHDSTYMYSAKSRLRRAFGPKKQYAGVGSDLRRSFYWGLGIVNLRDNKDLIIRGQQGRYTGIFSTDLSNSQSSFRIGSRVGFRCVFVP